MARILWGSPTGGGGEFDLARPIHHCAPGNVTELISERVGVVDEVVHRDANRKLHILWFSAHHRTGTNDEFAVLAWDNCNGEVWIRGTRLGNQSQHLRALRARNRGNKDTSEEFFHFGEIRARPKPDQPTIASIVDEEVSIVVGE